MNRIQHVSNNVLCILDSIWFPERGKNAGTSVHSHEVQDCCVHLKQKYCYQPVIVYFKHCMLIKIIYFKVIPSHCAMNISWLEE
jgi:hypothetical protein